FLKFVFKMKTGCPRRIACGSPTDVVHRHLSRGAFSRTRQLWCPFVDVSLEALRPRLSNGFAFISRYAWESADRPRPARARLASCLWRPNQRDPNLMMGF